MRRAMTAGGSSSGRRSEVEGRVGGTAVCECGHWEREHTQPERVCDHAVGEWWGCRCTGFLRIDAWKAEPTGRPAGRVK